MTQNNWPGRLADGRTPEAHIAELRQFFEENKNYYMDELRLVDLIDIVRMQLLAQITRPRMEKCPFANLDNNGVSFC